MEVNNKALRDALTETQSVIEKCMDIINKIPDSCGYGGLIDDAADELCALRDSLKDALAKPPRNCDVLFGADSPIRNADEAWLVFRNHNPDAYFDVPGLLRCIDWLLATATERKEEDNESKWVL